MDEEEILLVGELESREGVHRAFLGTQVDGSPEVDRPAYREEERAFLAFQEVVLRRAWVDPSWEVQLLPWAVLRDPSHDPWVHLCRVPVASVVKNGCRADDRIVSWV